MNHLNMFIFLHKLFINPFGLFAYLCLITYYVKKILHHFSLFDNKTKHNIIS